jgi:hypothetical protein
MTAFDHNEDQDRNTSPPHRLPTTPGAAAINRQHEASQLRQRRGKDRVALATSGGIGGCHPVRTS